MPNEITEITRRNIIDYLTASGANWAGRLPEDEFLARLYDLAALPSTDYRYGNAASDIRQHRLNWSDWQDDWVFYDARFNLLRASDEAFLRFLCETIHPVVRPNSAEAREMAASYSNELQADGWRRWVLPMAIGLSSPLKTGKSLSTKSNWLQNYPL